MTDCNTLGNHLRMYTTKREKIKKELEFRKQWIQHGRQAKGGHQVKGESSKMSIMQEVQRTICLRKKTSEDSEVFPQGEISIS